MVKLFDELTPAIDWPQDHRDDGESVCACQLERQGFKYGKNSRDRALHLVLLLDRTALEKFFETANSLS